MGRKVSDSEHPPKGDRKLNPSSPPTSDAKIVRQLQAASPSSPKTDSVPMDSSDDQDVVTDIKQAVRQNTTAAKGFAEAAYSLACCYEDGTGVVKDMKQAIALYAAAAQQGYAAAQNRLGMCYEDGTGVVKDMKRAIALYTAAAEQGSASAQYNLGGCYKEGKGVAKNIKRAVELYTEAALQDSPDALSALSECYEDGEGVKKNEELARELQEDAEKIPIDELGVDEGAEDQANFSNS